MALLKVCREHFLDYLPCVALPRDTTLTNLFLHVYYLNEDDQRPLPRATISTQHDIQSCRVNLAAYFKRRNEDHLAVETALLEAVEREREILTEDERTCLENVRYCFLTHILPSRNFSVHVLYDSIRREVGVSATFTVHPAQFRFSVDDFVRHLQTIQSLDRAIEDYILANVQSHFSQQRRGAEIYGMARERAERAPFRRSPGAERRTRRNGGDRAAETVQEIQSESSQIVCRERGDDLRRESCQETMQDPSPNSIDDGATSEIVQEGEICQEEIVGEGSTSRGVKKKLRRQAKEREEQEKKNAERQEKKKENRKKRKSKLQQKKNDEKALSTDDHLERETQVVADQPTPTLSRKKRKSKLEKKKRGEKALSTDDHLERETQVVAAQPTPTLSRSARILCYILMAILLTSLLMFLKP